MNSQGVIPFRTRYGKGDNVAEICEDRTKKGEWEDQDFGQARVGSLWQRLGKEKDSTGSRHFQVSFQGSTRSTESDHCVLRDYLDSSWGTRRTGARPRRRSHGNRHFTLITTVETVTQEYCDTPPQSKVSDHVSFTSPSMTTEDSNTNENSYCNILKIHD